MKMIHLLILIPLSFSCAPLISQTFTRSVLPTQLTTPWEIQYGPDNYLWITEDSGVVSRVHPVTGDKKIVYAATDYFAGSPEEQLQRCFAPEIGAGTLGMDLHPDFMTDSTAYIYYMYSYNAGTMEEPATKFKVARLKWDHETETVTDKVDLINHISTGYDHLGGRLMVIRRADVPHIYFTVGDHGISETNSPDCYEPQSDNPNNFAQDPNTDNGKIHRYNIDGTIPDDNPIPGNSFYTRGHRNPQGLMYIPEQDVLFDIEHGDRTDDEINILLPGMNYGWKWVRGYHSDNNFPGEAEFIAGYTPHPMIENDRLVEAFYSWCDEPQPASDEFLEWCTPAPSDGIYYGSNGIPEWEHSLLVVNLKDGTQTDRVVHVFRLTEDGMNLLPSEADAPNPATFFAEDQEENGRLRDITFSPDGRQLFLINNVNASSGGIAEKITVYTIQTTGLRDPEKRTPGFHPNPVSDVLSISDPGLVHSIEIYDLSGVRVFQSSHHTHVDVSALPAGTYLTQMTTVSGERVAELMIKL